MKFPDDETLRRLREFERLRPTREQQQQIDALSRMSNAERRAMDEVTRPTSYAERIAREKMNELSAFESLTGRSARREIEAVAALIGQNRYEHKHMVDLFSGAGSALRPVMTQLFLSNAQQVAMEAMKSIDSPALSRSVREAAAVLLFQHDNVLRNATMHAVRNLWRPDNATFQAFRTDAFANNLMEYVRRSAESSEATEEAIEELQRIVEKKVAELPHGRVSMDALLSIAVAVILFLANIAYLEMKENQQPKTDPLTPQQIERLIQSIEKSQTLAPPDDKADYYVVQRAVCIRVKPQNRSAKVAVLYPNQKVRLEKSAHRWIYVEYFDYIEGIPKMGWVNKKYLQRVD